MKEEDYFRIIKTIFGGEDVFVQFKKDPFIDSAAFDHKNKTIIANPEFAKKYVENVSNKKSAEKYVLTHELEHFIQVCEDFEEYSKSFELPKDWSENDKSKEYVWRHLFNAIYDLNVINKIEDHFVPFRKKEIEGDTPSELYEKVLFKEKDYRNIPKSVQFCSALLRERVIPQRIKIDDDVREIFNKKIKSLGKEGTLQEIVYEFTKANVGPLELNYLIEKIIKPEFEKLIKKDQKEGKLPLVLEIPIPTFGDFPGGPGKGGISDFIEYIKEKRSDIKSKLEKKGEDLFSKFCKGAGIEDTVTKRVIGEINKSSEEYVDKIKELWYKTMQIEEKEYDIKKVGYKKGTGVDIPSLIRQYPTVLTKPHEAAIFYRYESEVKEEIKPKKVKLALVLDMSESMDEKKRKKVLETMYPVLKSLYAFETELALNNPKGKSPIEIETKVIGFGGKGNVMELSEDKDKDKFANLIKSMRDFYTYDLGGTCDDQALKEANNFFSEKDLEEIKEGKLMGLVIELTDGDTATKENSKKMVEKMKKRGILVKGIRIPPSEEKENFEYVFGKDGKPLENIKQLKEVMETLLKEVLVKEKKHSIIFLHICCWIAINAKICLPENLIMTCF